MDEILNDLQQGEKEYSEKHSRTYNGVVYKSQEDYRKLWREGNPDKVKLQNKRNNDKNKEKREAWRQRKGFGFWGFMNLKFYLAQV